MIENFVTSDSIILELDSTERDEVLAELTECICRQNSSINRDEIFQALLEREEKASTIVSKFMAVPHAACESVDKTTVAIGISHKGIDYNFSTSGEDSVAKIFFCVVFPKDVKDDHLYTLRDISVLSQIPNFVESILFINNTQEILNFISKAGE